MFKRALTVALDVYGEDNRVPAMIMLNYARSLRTSKESRAAANWQRRGDEALRRSLRRETGIIDVEELRAAGR